MAVETLSFPDGTTTEVVRSDAMTEFEWLETKQYMEGHPGVTKALEEASSNPDTIRKEKLMQAITSVWERLMKEGDDEFARKIKALEEDAEFEAMFEGIKACDTEMIRSCYADDFRMMRVSKKMGGVPRECKPTLEKIRKTPLTLQEACKFGDMKQLQQYLSETEGQPELREVDARDHRGVTCLGYAIGANRMAITRLLVESKADPTQVDHSCNNGCHYAAAYGRKDILEYLIGLGVTVNAPNSGGLTPLDVATKNQRKDAVETLTKHGAKLSKA